MPVSALVSVKVVSWTICRVTSPDPGLALTHLGVVELPGCQYAVSLAKLPSFSVGSWDRCRPCQSWPSGRVLQGETPFIPKLPLEGQVLSQERTA